MKMLIKHKITSKYKMLIENTQEMIIFFDSDGKITDCNKAAINELGYSANIYKIPINEIFKKAINLEFNAIVINAKYQNKMEESIAYRKNQTCFPVDLKIVIMNEKNTFIGICTAINISDKKEAFRDLNHMNNELLTFNKSRNEFVANITHELRTPVNGILGLSDNLLDTELTPRQVETVNIIHRCCTNMNTIINDLLDYAKISNNKLEIEQREFNFRDFIHYIVDINKIRISEKGLKLLVNISNDIPERVIGDEFRLAQVLNNLFSNAVKFTSFGQIALEVIKISKNDQMIELFFMLIDTGIGISLEEKDKLFQSFSQVDGSITRRFGGTGLGLSISKKLVEAMHGSIVVDSEKNKGSTFSFSVRLGIPQTSENDSDLSFSGDMEFGLDERRNRYKETLGESSHNPEMDYIGRMLLEAKISPAINNDNLEINLMEEAIRDITFALEKLTLCIEMESWEKAEELAYYMKKLIPMDQVEITKNVFRLLLAVRKENHDVSIAILNELKAVIKEVI